MEGTAFQKGLSDADLPAIAAQRGRMQDYRDQRKLVII
jgi:hypothetical protein